jgi:hypothetical protein
MNYCRVWGVACSTAYVDRKCRCDDCREWQSERRRVQSGRLRADERQPAEVKTVTQSRGKRRQDVGPVALPSRAIGPEGLGGLGGLVAVLPVRRRQVGATTVTGPVPEPAPGRGVRGRFNLGRRSQGTSRAAGALGTSLVATVECKLACGHSATVAQDQARGHWIVCPACRTAAGIMQITGDIKREPLGAVVDPNWPRQAIMPAGAVGGAQRRRR